MPKFKILVGRDARSHYSATIEAPDLASAKAMHTRRGFRAPEGTIWEDDGTQDFDQVETVTISDPETEEELAIYEAYDGWQKI